MTGAKIIAAILFVWLVVWPLLLPTLVVLSLLPQVPFPLLDWFTASPKVATIAADNLAIDIYQPGRGQPRNGLVLLHAANDQGKDDPRLRSLAVSLSRAGLLVYAPTLPGLNRQVFHPRVIAEMEQVIKLAQSQHPELRWSVMSFSIGVGPILIAAGRLPDLKFIVAFGGYADLENVVAFHTTGQGQDPFGIWLLARYYAQFLPAGDAKIFYELAERKWQNPEAGIADLASDLGPAGRAALALLLNRDPQAVPRLLLELPQALKDFLAALDPKPHLAAIQAPVLLLHSRHDPVIPFAQSEKLFAELERRGKSAQLLELRVFDHVNPVLPPVSWQNLKRVYLPELATLYRAAFQIIY